MYKGSYYFYSPVEDIIKLADEIEERLETLIAQSEPDFSVQCPDNAITSLSFTMRLNVARLLFRQARQAIIGKDDASKTEEE